MSAANAWTDWLASIGYGIDFNSDADPPCTLDELAAAYVRVTGEEDVETWAWCIRENTGAFRTTSETVKAAVAMRTGASDAAR